MELTAERICKSIKGKVILKDVSLSMQGGKVYGFAGRNGSGKTMLFRALSGLMRIDGGRVVWNGETLHQDFSVLPSLGIVLENAGLYPDLTGYENLRYLADLTGRIGEREIREAIRRVGLAPEDGRTYRKYSLGMKQRLALAQAIMEKPDVIMLDEPTNALDEDGVSDIRELIWEEKDRGALILIASHNREDMEMLADEVYIMESGKLSRK